MLAGGQNTITKYSLTYLSVVSREILRTALINYALNYLKILACNIQNAYLTSKFRENIWTVTGPDFGSEQGKVMIVVRELY